MYTLELSELSPIYTHCVPICPMCTLFGLLFVCLFIRTKYALILPTTQVTFDGEFPRLWRLRSRLTSLPIWIHLKECILSASLSVRLARQRIAKTSSIQSARPLPRTSALQYHLHRLLYRTVIKQSRCQSSTIPTGKLRLTTKVPTLSGRASSSLWTLMLVSSSSVPRKANIVIRCLP
ncbi:hypothetical protein BT63DRAFT_207075 [Microthyrium microscopicum]|uniref:Uncharacterized protein n=1 Tax=Microthyrium microscopicum TaxID=703497 RepID=A0A6A6UHM7_9PEZI|nr:hypothetical protein BT63DRAFT_207075 [Microthyrium microscopicum]